MKHFTFISLIFLLALGVIELPAEAQRRGNTYPNTQVAKTSGIQETGSGIPTERERIIAECEIPDRPKPGPEAEINVVSPLCGKAISLPKPSYPTEARKAKAAGVVTITVVVDENGRVIWAKAVEGHPLLREEARKAACRAQSSPTRISGRPVKTQTSIYYNFVL